MDHGDAAKRVLTSDKAMLDRKAQRWNLGKFADQQDVRRLGYTDGRRLWLAHLPSQQQLPRSAKLGERRRIKPFVGSEQREPYYHSHLAAFVTMRVERLWHSMAT